MLKYLCVANKNFVCREQNFSVNRCRSLKKVENHFYRVWWELYKDNSRKALQNALTGTEKNKNYRA
jgi:hypothetical protein